MRELLELLEHDGRRSIKELATMLGRSEYEIEEQMKKLEKEKIILGYNTMIDWEKYGDDSVSAMIEVNVTPQREFGFDAIAERIYRFDEVKRIEAMSPEEKFAFFQSELSKCIRCNACRNVCPACSCRKCVFDSTKFDSAQKANVDDFEEKMFHIIRAFHVAGRCTDCGECSRVCPQGIPLHLFNRKFIKDIDKFYGEYQAGEDTDSKAPLTNFTFDDVEPSIVGERG